MRCANAIGRIHDWFDTSGSEPMPTDLRLHVVECVGCRTFITRWNVIELGLASLKETAPNLHRDLTTGISARLAQKRPMFTWPLLPRPQPAIIAGLLACLPLAACGIAYYLWLHQPSRTTLARGQNTATQHLASEPPVNNLPLANTGSH